MKIGIGITTRNRPEVLEMALQHFIKYRPENSKIVVIDDSDEEIKLRNREIILKYFPDDDWHHIANIDERMGIAKAKNEALKELQDCDHIFLFDDDCFPAKRGWAELYIETAQKNDMHHLMHLIEVGDLAHTQTRNGVKEFNNCGGVLLYFTNHAIKTVGGYRKEFGIYGYEHADISQRCHKAGLSGTFGPFVTPTKSEDYIYSIDLNFVHRGKQPPMGKVSLDTFKSSIHGEDVTTYINHNAPYYNTGSIHEKLN